ncbi:MAG: hypothetical protein ACXW3D_05230 [Caulobacteraceae bacterium]
MKISIPGVLIAAIVITLIGWIWGAHFAGVAPGAIPGSIITSIKASPIAAGMALGNSLLIALGLGWVIGLMRDRSVVSGLGAGVAAVLFFVLTTISTAYVQGGLPMGPELHPLLMATAGHLLQYVIAGMIIGAMAPKRSY